MADLDKYDYKLPPELIAQTPLSNRVDSRLMVVNRTENSIEHFHFRDLPSFLQPGDALVLNDTRVVRARLVGYRNATGGRWQGLFLESDDRNVWKILCKARGKLAEGEKIGLVDRSGQAAGELTLLARLDHGEWAAKLGTTESTFEALERMGRVPLPHYIRKGEAIPADTESYQCVFAKHPGSVAAPTAGLHFTNQLLTVISDLGVEVVRVTLHVGVGTFRPIKTENLDDHKMHAEWCEITEDTAARLRGIRKAGGRIIAVGTTSVRVVESAANVDGIQAWQSHTELFIRPPYDFKGIDCLITNFHLPRSSLLVLVDAFAGNDLLRRAYETAIEEEYRFFSYGDAMLII